MKDGGFKVQAFGICFVALVAILVGYGLTRPKKRRPPPLLGRPTHLPVKILVQEEGVPGKVITVKKDGAAVMSYKCRPDDAAVVAIATRDLGTGVSVTPRIVSATTPDGSQYLAEVEPFIEPIGTVAPVAFITIKRGFSIKPPAVNLVIAGDMGYGSDLATITITRLATPIREVLAPRPEESKAAEKLVSAEVNDLGGAIDVTPLQRYSNEIYDVPDVLDSSFGIKTKSFLPATYTRAIDAVKVRVTRVRKRNMKTTLIYKNARVVEAEGKPFLLLPDEEAIGTILGRNLMLGNNLPTKGVRSLRTNVAVNREVRIRWEEQNTVGIQTSANEVHAGFNRLGVVGIDPDIEDMGLDSLRVFIRNQPDIYVGPDGYATTFKAKHHPTSPKITNIPELKFQVQLTHTDEIDSRIVVVPVHHVRRALGSLPPPPPLIGVLHVGAP